MFIEYSDGLQILELISKFNVNYASIKNFKKIFQESEFTKIVNYKFSSEKSLYANKKKVEFKAQFIIYQKCKNIQLNPI